MAYNGMEKIWKCQKAINFSLFFLDQMGIGETGEPAKWRVEQEIEKSRDDKLETTLENFTFILLDIPKF